MSIDMIMKANYDPEGLRRELMRYKKKDLIDFVIWMGQSIQKLKSSPKERKCDGCNSSHPPDHLLEFEGKYYCCFCFGDIQEEKANWSE